MKVRQLDHQEGGHNIGAVGSACAHGNRVKGVFSGRGGETAE